MNPIEQMFSVEIPSETQAVWQTRGRGFGRVTGWATPWEFVIVRSHGPRPKGVVGIFGNRWLNLETGKITKQ